jgi:photosystem II stability/assembly factor-like uncharacterized protein
VRRSLAVVGLVLCGLALAVPADVAAPRPPLSGWRGGNPRPQGETLWDVEFSDRTGYAVGGFGTLLKTRGRGRTWSKVETGLYQYFDHVRVFSPRSFLIAGGCWLMSSRDGGATGPAYASAAG